MVVLYDDCNEEGVSLHIFQHNCHECLCSSVAPQNKWFVVQGLYLFGIQDWQQITILYTWQFSKAWLLRQNADCNYAGHNKLTSCLGSQKGPIDKLANTLCFGNNILQKSL